MNSSLKIPSYGTGFARCAAEAEYPELWKGLVGLWAPYLGATGLTLHDWGGRKNHGALTNMDPATDWVPSLYGPALRYTENDRVVCGNLIRLNGAAKASWSFWIRPSRVDHSNKYFCSHNAFAGYAIKQAQSGIRAYFGSTSNYACTGNGFLSVNTWCHVLVVYDGIAATVRIYIDGSDTNAGITGTIPGTLGSGANPFQIGGYGSTYYFEGLIGPVAVWSRDLVPSEGLRLWNPHALTRLRQQIFPAAAAPPGVAPTSHLYGSLVGPLGGAV